MGTVCRLRRSIALGPANTPFSLVDPERRLSQPTVRATAFLERRHGRRLRARGERRQPLPESDGRFGFGVPTHDVALRGGLGDQALAVRVSGTQVDVDWAAHVFGGLSRRPTFVPRFTADAGLAGVDAIYTRSLQVGGELETTRADWRFLGRRVRPRAARRRDGPGADLRLRGGGGRIPAPRRVQRRLQRHSRASSSWPTPEATAPTSRSRPSLRAGMRIARHGSCLPAQVDVAYSLDWVFRGHGVMASVEKALAESPTMNLGFRFTAFSAGARAERARHLEGRPRAVSATCA